VAFFTARRATRRSRLGDLRAVLVRQERPRHRGRRQVQHELDRTGSVSATSALIATGKTINAILYDYANQTVNIVQTYQHAKLAVPDQVTWTSDNQLLQLWQQDQTSSDPWKLAYSSSINFEGNIALAALMNHLAGKTVTAS